jgi:hypothetical protein
MRALAAMMFLAGLLAVASFSDAQPPGKDKEKKDKGGKGGKPVSVDEMVTRLMAFDKNADGKLTKEELNDARLTALFDRADANKDGSVTKDELTTLLTKEAAAVGTGGGPGGKGPPGGEKGPPPGGKGPPPPSKE